MEYEFLHDPITGNALAKFSIEHQVFGPWIEVELGNSDSKYHQINTLIKEVRENKKAETLLVGQEYSLIITKDEVAVQANFSEASGMEVPDLLLEQELHIDAHGDASCGMEDFLALLASWRQFVPKEAIT